MYRADRCRAKMYICVEFAAVYAGFVQINKYLPFPRCAVLFFYSFKAARRFTRNGLADTEAASPGDSRQNASRAAAPS